MPSRIALRTTDSVVKEIETVDAEIRRRAYALSHQRAHQGEGPADDWLQAERDVTWRPAIELSRHGARFIVTAAVAGVEPGQLDIALTSEDLLLQADVQHRHARGGDDVHLCEFHHGRLFRSVHFPEQIQPDKARVVLKNGLLRLTVPLAGKRPPAGRA